MFLIVCSIPDVASMNILDHLLKAVESDTGEWEELAIPVHNAGIARLFSLNTPASHETNTETTNGAALSDVPVSFPDVYLAVIPEMHLEADHVERRVLSALNSMGDSKSKLDPTQKYTEADLHCLIFPSKHRAESGKRSFTVHPMGNYRPEALYGGMPRTLSQAAPRYMSEALRILKRRHAAIKSLADFDVSFEVTHHGPLTDIPSFFIEIGSSEHEWEIPEAGELLAATILELVCSSRKGDGNKPDSPGKRPVALGLGGGHYAPRFSDAAVSDGIDFAHMIPGYALKGLDDELTREMMRKSVTADESNLNDDGSHKNPIYENGVYENDIHDTKITVYAHGKKHRKYYHFFEGSHAEIVELR